MPYAVNVFQYIRNLDQNFISGTISQNICKFAFQYVIQIAHAFSIAHQNDLTHNRFTLGSVLVCATPDNLMKVNSFKPWLVRKPPAGSIITEADMLQMAKCKDLLDFGVSLFELMIGKKEEFTETTKVTDDQQDNHPEH